MKTSILSLVFVLFSVCLSNAQAFVDSLHHVNETYNIYVEIKVNLNNYLASKQAEKKVVELSNQYFDEQVVKLRTKHVALFTKTFNAEEQAFVENFVKAGYHKYLNGKELADEPEDYKEKYEESIANEAYDKLVNYLTDCSNEASTYYTESMTTGLMEIITKNVKKN